MRILATLTTSSTNTTICSPTITTDAYTLTIPAYTLYNNETSATNYLNTVNTIYDMAQDALKKIDEVEGKKTPMNKFKFGPITDGSVAQSIYGIAVKNSANEWVVYDAKQDEIISVDGMIFETKNTIFTMPVSMKDVQIGDVILHHCHYCYVMDGDEKMLNVIDISDGSVKDILPSKSPFGFNFVTKVTSLLPIGEPSADSPFGDNFVLYAMMANGGLDKNMLPLLLMQNKDKIDPMILMMLCSK